MVGIKKESEEHWICILVIGVMAFTVLIYFGNRAEEPIKVFLYSFCREIV
jgi:hypothetical protein